MQLNVTIQIYGTVAWFLAMGMVCRAAEEKGYRDIKLRLWLIGLLVTPICSAVLAAAFLDKKVQRTPLGLQ
jgi:peptidoglycan/LPS O-acetylase OafA/YrhL